MPGFTLEQYRELILALQSSQISFRMLHDVDARPNFALRMAELENSLGIHTTYYFRANQFSKYQNIIHTISCLGHSVGYHYECLTTCKGNIEKAYVDFKFNLHRLREITHITTACAHGSPLSTWDNKNLWKLGDYDIHDLGIEYEPMLDTDFSKTLYLTDTGRQWDGYKMSVRDKVSEHQEEWIKEGLSFHTTSNIIHALSDLQHPIHQKTLLINTHPQRWMPFGAQWVMEAGLQWWKNQAKRLIVKRRQK